MRLVAPVSKKCWWSFLWKHILHFWWLLRDQLLLTRVLPYPLIWRQHFGVSAAVGLLLSSCSDGFHDSDTLNALLYIFRHRLCVFLNICVEIVGGCFLCSGVCIWSSAGILRILPLARLWSVFVLFCVILASLYDRMRTTDMRPEWQKWGWGAALYSLLDVCSLLWLDSQHVGGTWVFRFVWLKSSASNNKKTVEVGFLELTDGR